MTFGAAFRLRRFSVLVALLTALPLVSGERAAADAKDKLATYRTWIDEMKHSSSGPFVHVRWFCKDGTIWPPKAYACRDHGGGLQHGEWNRHAVELRAAGYQIGNIFADMDGSRFVGADADLPALEQILLERFLIGIDDGWIFRGARSYRGALQAEDEQGGARRVLLQMLADPLWLQPERYIKLREAVRLFPLQRTHATSSDVRNLATQIAVKDPQFQPLRAKIHSMPDAGDARRVRSYAASLPAGSATTTYEELAGGIDRLYAATAAADETLAVVQALPVTSLTTNLKTLAGNLGTTKDAAARFGLAAQLLEGLRDSLADAGTPERRLALLQASLSLEDEAYAAGNTASSQQTKATRNQRLQWLDRNTAAIYGAGLIEAREMGAVRDTIRRLRDKSPLVLSDYRDELRYLSRVPEWTLRWLRFQFGISMERLSAIEPLAHRYVGDRVRGSSLIVYGTALDALLLDADALAGCEHELFGERVGGGLRALNPGLARGVLRTVDPQRATPFEPTDIYLLPETTPDLPPVAGILTEGEGSSLSHVQLLARNLGIPNLVVGYHLLPKVRANRGNRVVLAVSPNGVAQLSLDGPQWDKVFGEQKVADDIVLEADLQKLDLQRTELVPLDRLRADDSGRVSGPKGAKLGELRHAFGDAVPPGFVIPFGAFRKLLDHPLEPGGPRAWDWMIERYAAINTYRGDADSRRRLVSEFLEKLRNFIMTVDLDAEFLTTLRATLTDTFGADGTYGVFVRSDTNVEDLPGFTGAGLNLTVPNVVGTDQIIEALRRVWASPFTDRAYAWRQARMKQPEYVFPAVLIQYSFPAQKSGVLVTADLERGEPGWLTVAVNEGVGGAVEGQAAESLRIRDEDEVRFLARATAPLKAVLAPNGGITYEPASGTPSVLTQDEIRQLVRLAAGVPQRFPSLRDANGAPAPADIEFAFRGGKLALLQIRPLVENRAAERNRYITSLDATMRARANEKVDLDALPKSLPSS